MTSDQKYVYNELNDRYLTRTHTKTHTPLTASNLGRFLKGNMICSLSND